ncbi:WecB/TagA/CpsF family glycosyltransferase [Pseudomonadota bacterium]
MTSTGACTEIFGRNIELVGDPDLARLVNILDQSPDASVFFCNVHMLMLSRDDPALADAMDDADFVFADGVPVSWLQKKITGADAQTVRGYQLMQAICRHAVKNNQAIGLIGSTPEVMATLVGKLSETFEGLSIGYHHSPPYSPGELQTSEEVLNSIRTSGITWLFAGFGCPKQEKWVNHFKNEVNCKILAVGAAFDWLAGTTKKPPDWMENIGLAWLYRLLQDPGKMWSRYLVYNTKFIVSTAWLLLTRERSK